MHPVQLDKDLFAYDLGLKYKNTLIFGDLHLGYEESLHKEGVFIPPYQLKDTVERFSRIFAATGKVGRIILTGDVKHEFGKISNQEWHDVLHCIDFLKQQCQELIILEGNHDKVTKYITEKRDVVPCKEYILNDILVLHGDRIPSAKNIQKAKKIIIGHEHPAVILKESKTSVRSEKFKCFLKGKWKRKTLIVLPSSNLLTEGTDIRGKLLSPFLQQSLAKFELWVVADEVRYFGKVKDLV